MYDTLHWPEDSVHVVADNVPVALLDHATEPVGLAPASVAVHVEAVPTMNGMGPQTMEVETVTGEKLIASSTQPKLELS